MKKFLLTLLALCVVAALCAALAEGVVRTTASVNLRSGPGLEYGKVAAVPPDTELAYLGEISTDERGVDWYKVQYDDAKLWISSRYSELTEFDAPYDGYGEYDADADPGELSNYYLGDLPSVAVDLAATYYREDPDGELQNYYYNDALTVGGNDVAEHFTLSGPGYTLFGVRVGMPVEEARQALTDAGLTAYEGAEDYFRHPAGERSLADVDGFDSGVSLVCDAQGLVTEIAWDSYTG